VHVMAYSTAFRLLVLVSRSYLYLGFTTETRALASVVSKFDT
jgi:hypothetical protein